MLSRLIAIAASRFRSSALRPLQVVCAATLLLVVADLATGARIELSSVLGYSTQNGDSFTGIGNSTFSVLAATGIMAGLLGLDLEVTTVGRR